MQIHEPGPNPAACPHTQATSQELTSIQQPTQCPTSWVTERPHCPRPQHGLTPSEFGFSPYEAESHPIPFPPPSLKRLHSGARRQPSNIVPITPTLNQKPLSSVTPSKTIYRTPTMCPAWSSRLESTQDKKVVVCTLKVTSPRDETLVAFPELRPKKGRAGKARPVKQYLWSKLTARKSILGGGACIHAGSKMADLELSGEWPQLSARASFPVASGDTSTRRCGDTMDHWWHNYPCFRSLGLNQSSAPSYLVDPPGVSVSPVEDRSVRTSFFSLDIARSKESTKGSVQCQTWLSRPS